MKIEEQHATFVQSVDDGLHAVFILHTDRRADIHAILHHIRIIGVGDKWQVLRHRLAGRKPGSISFHHDRMDTETLIVVFGTTFEIVSQVVGKRRFHLAIFQRQTRYVVAYIVIRNSTVTTIPQVAEEVTTEAIAHVAGNATIIATAKDIFHHRNGNDIMASNDKYGDLLTMR